MIDTGKRFRDARKNMGLSIAQAADKLGVARSSIIKWESGRHKPRRHLEEVARLYNTSADYLMGLSDEPRRLDDRLLRKEGSALQKEIERKFMASLETEETILVPVYDGAGCDPAGFGLDDNNYPVGVEAIPAHLSKSKDDCIAVVCRGDSMTGNGIEEGDRAIIRKMNGTVADANNKVALLRVREEFDYTGMIKLVKFDAIKQILMLVSSNDKYEPRIFFGEEINDVYLVGLVVSVTHDFLGGRY